MISSDATVVTTIERPGYPSSGAQTDGRWNGLYRTGAVASLVTAIFIPIQIIAFIIWIPPDYNAIAKWFAVFHENAIGGLMRMDLLLMADYVLLIPIVLALYVALYRRSPSLMVVAVALFFVSIAAYLASNTAFQMLLLSNHYASATTAAARAPYVAAGQAMMATYQGTSFIAYYMLGSLAGMFAGIAMLRSTSFSRAAAYAAIMGNGVGLALYVPVVGIFLSVLSGAILWIWYFLVARDLWRLGQAGPGSATG